MHSIIRVIDLLNLGIILVADRILVQCYPARPLLLLVWGLWALLLRK
jgi:hypothetical protein